MAILRPEAQNRRQRLRPIGTGWACAGLWLGAVACSAAWAEPRLDNPPVLPPAVQVASIQPAAPPAAALASAPSPDAPPAVVAPMVMPAPGVAVLPTDWRARAALDLRRATRSGGGSGFSVVELPPEGVPDARSRPHHALSMQSDTPRRMLRSIGIDATDCATRFRVPTKMKRDVYGGSSIEVRATLGLACSF